jgi:hypothetical protein
LMQYLESKWFERKRKPWGFGILWNPWLWRDIAKTLRIGGLVQEKKAVIGWIRIRVITQKGKQCGFCVFWPMFNPYGLWVMEWWVYSFSFNNLTQKVLFFFSVNILYEFNGKCNFLGNLLHRKNSYFLFFWTLKYTGTQIEKIKAGKLFL